MRGISYEEKRNRWRCFHVSGTRTFQLRFPSEREAFWKKIELCADDGVFPNSKSVKEGNKNAQSTKSGISNLPVGIREHFSKSRNRWRVIAHLPNGDVDQYSTREYRYEDGNYKSRERVIRQESWDRYEHFKACIVKEAERHTPINKALLNRLFESTEVALQNELNQCFKESSNGLPH
ncbi:hypothetical protein BM526_20375 (plasmid) [Alteromonas mediterranea]|uniref:hypothetical protein n=1 Tax=Alteromonas mediterranea TaxID=314275 RepID=UPI0009034F61|nr:hypothetical protein [Alteromonas mediterranea]APE04331.1 hypothetical protein BM526_20375 [Alteromonas mediterranea]